MIQALSRRGHARSELLDHLSGEAHPSPDQEHTLATAVRPLALLLSLALGACKPAEEPPRAALTADARPAPTRSHVALPPPSGTVLLEPGQVTPEPSEIVAERVTGGDDGDAQSGRDSADAIAGSTEDTGLAPSDSITSDGPTDAVPTDTIGPTPGGSPSATAAALGVRLPEALVSAALAPVSPERQRLARRFNRAGLVKHRRLELEAAIRDYLAALERWPGHRFSNYNLACAYALTGALDKALTRLALIGALGGDVSRERLRVARLDPDFDALLDDPRFRALTGYAPVTITWSASLDRRQDAERLAEELRRAGVPARAAPTPWPSEVSRPTLLHLAREPIAAAMAEEVADALKLGRLDREARSELNTTRAVVLVLPGDPNRARDRDRPPSAPTTRLAPAPLTVTTTSPPLRFEDLVGVRLVARRAGAVRTLRLKATGFFSWEIAEPDGARISRSGRYTFKGDSLALEYRERREEPTDDPGRPKIVVEEGRRASPAIEVNSEGLVIDGELYRRGP